MEIFNIEPLSDKRTKTLEDFLRQLERETGKHFQLVLKQAFSEGEITICPFENRKFSLQLNDESTQKFRFYEGMRIRLRQNKGFLKNDFFQSLVGTYQNKQEFDEKAREYDRQDYFDLNIGINYSNMSAYYTSGDICENFGSITFL